MAAVDLSGGGNARCANTRARKEASEKRPFSRGVFLWDAGGRRGLLRRGVCMCVCVCVCMCVLLVEEGREEEKIEF
jgi:hypothetical protein